MFQSDQQTCAHKINNISEYLTLHAGLSPARPALLYPEKITYSDMEEKVNRYSFGLGNSGIRAGTISLVLVPAGTDFFILIFALLRIGAIPVMIDPGMGIRAMSSVLADLRTGSFYWYPESAFIKVSISACL